MNEPHEMPTPLVFHPLAVPIRGHSDLWSPVQEQPTAARVVLHCLPEDDVVFASSRSAVIGSVKHQRIRWSQRKGWTLVVTDVFMTFASAGTGR